MGRRYGDELFDVEEKARRVKSYLTQYDRDRQELLSRLRWQYGPERALRIMSGDDAPTEEDRKAFRMLGLGKNAG